MKIKYLTYAAITLGLFVPVPAMAGVKILFNCFAPPQYYMCSILAPELKKRIETSTGNRVQITIPPKSVVAPGDQFDAVVNGTIDGAFQFNGFLGAQAPGMNFSLLPFVGAPEAEVSGPALWETYVKFFGEKNEFGDAVLISVYTSSGSEFFSTIDKPIETIHDLADRKMWALPGSAASVVKATGSPVVAGPAVQMLELVSRGVIDGYTGVQWDAAANFKLLDYTKSATITKVKLFQPTFSVYLSRAKWKEISPDDQNAIMKVMSLDFAKFAGHIADEHNNNGLAAGKAAGVKLITGAPELEDGLRKLGKPLIDTWAAKVGGIGVDGYAVLAYYEAQQQKFSAELGK